MKKAAVRDIVNQCLRPIKVALGLNDWYIVLHWEKADCKNPMAMSTRMSTEYREAHIGLCHKLIEDDPVLLRRYVRHELLHIVAYPSFVMREMLDASMEAFKGVKMERNFGRAISNQCVAEVAIVGLMEAFVVQLEHTFDTLGMTPDMLEDIGCGIINNDQVGLVERNVIWAEDF